MRSNNAPRPVLPAAGRGGAGAAIKGGARRWHAEGTMALRFTVWFASLLWTLLLLGTQVAPAAGSEPQDPNQRAARSPSVPCEPGHYLTEDCYMGQAMGCCPCPPGSFLSHPNREMSCSLCTPCREDQEMVSDCTPTRDRQCQCKTREYYCDSEPCPESCHRCTSCPGATLQTCNATRDTVCAPAAPAESGPSAGFLAVSVLVVSVVALIIAWWWRRGLPLPQWPCRFRKPASAEPGSHSHVPKSSGPLVSSPETRDAGAPVPTTGARRLPGDRLDLASEPLILPESPAGADGPWLEVEAGPHTGHHGLTPLHPLLPWPEGQPEVLVGRVGAEGPRAAAEEPARLPSRLRDQVATQDGLESKRSHPSRRGSVVSTSDCAGKDQKFHFWSRVWIWVAGSLLTACQSLCVR